MSKEILDAIGGLKTSYETKASEAAASIAEVKAAFEKKFADQEAAKTEQEKKFTEEVKTLNEDLAKKGATLEEIQKQVLEMKAKAGRFKGAGGGIKTAQEDINEGMEKAINEIKMVSKGHSAAFELKTVGVMTAAANLTGNVVATYDLTPQVRGRRKINIRDLVPVINSATGVWKFYIQDIPAGEGSIDFQSAAGAAKNQLDYDLTETTVTCKYMSGFVRFDKGMAGDLPFLTSYVSSEMLEDFKRSESQSFFTTLTGGATGSATTGASVLAEKYIDWIANLMGNDYNPSAIVTTAANWATILKTKPNDYSIPGGVVIDDQGNVRFVGIPLVAQNNIASGKTLIGDFSKAAIIQQEGLSFNFFEQDSDNVQKNLITARIEAREQIGILRPDAFIYA